MKELNKVSAKIETSEGVPLTRTVRLQYGLTRLILLVAVDSLEEVI